MRTATLSCLGLLVAAAAAPAQQRDEFIAGYASAMLEREFGLAASEVVVTNGQVRVRGVPPGAAEQHRIREALLRLRGVASVEFVEATIPARETAAAAGTERSDFQPRGSLLFEPLHADPRWPHFSAAWHVYSEGNGLENVAATSFGESFSFVRRDTEGFGRWELGLQAGVFSIFDLDADSFDLVNADYMVGPVFTWNTGPLTAMARLYHQSSHLGDEYLLRTQPERINLSYEVLDVLASVDATDDLRVYAGGGYVLHSHTPLERWLLQAGAEWYGPMLGGDSFRPVVACDVQSREENDWHGDVSLRAGVELGGPADPGGRLQVMLEYYRGRSPNGQFFEQQIEYVGLGLHLYF